MNKLEMAELVLKTSMESGDEWFANVESVLERQLEEVKRYRERFHAADGYSAPNEVLSWTVTHLVGTMNNLRLDMAVNHGVRVAEAHHNYQVAAKNWPGEH